MNVGKTLFAQIMEFVPWTSFSRIVERHDGNAGVRRMPCAEQFRIMAFAQLTWHESLRDIEVTLAANTNKLYALGLRHNVHRSTLADANEARDWRMWADVAAWLIRRARKLYRDCDLGLDWINTVYALDATTIDLCLSVFDWAPFRSAKAAVKMHTLLDLRGAIPAFIHISDGKMHEVNVLDFLAAAARAPRSHPFDRITPPTSQNSAVKSDIAPPQNSSRDPVIVSEPGENALPPSKIFFFTVCR